MIHHVFQCLLLAMFLNRAPVVAEGKPNIVLLLTDDQDLLLGGMSPISRIVAFLSDGAYLKNFFVNTPVCCPSRSTLISGRYPHNFLYNEGHQDNNPSCMHMNASSTDFEQKSIAVYLKKLGYTTGQFGKYLNPSGMKYYCEETSPAPLPGFDRWFSMCNDNTYFNNKISDNGKLKTYGTDPSDYLTSIIGNATLSFMEDSLKHNEPFFAYIAPHAPHVPATPAPWYEDTLPYMLAPRTPNYNFTASDHHKIVRSQSPLDPFGIAPQVDELFRNRWRSLLSVDDLMMDVVDKLTEYGQLDNTYFLFTSDHGFQLGQFNLPSCKLQPYEHDIRVPMFVKGPGIPKSLPSFVAGMVDIAPTIITLAGGEPPSTMDGRSFEDMIKKRGQGSNVQQNAWRDKHMLEYWSLSNDVIRYQHYIDGPNNTFIGVRLINETYNYLYVEFYQNTNPRYFTDPAVEYELFDLSKDPYQKVNLYGTDKEDIKLVNELHGFLHQQLLCSGSDCV